MKNAWEIEKNGKPVEWKEKAYDRDGWEYERKVSGYEYEGKRYILRDDRDGWLEAIEVK